MTWKEELFSTLPIGCFSASTNGFIGRQMVISYAQSAQLRAWQDPALQTGDLASCTLPKLSSTRHFTKLVYWYASAGGSGAWLLGLLD